MSRQQVTQRTPEEDFGLHPNDHREADDNHLATSRASADTTQKIPEATYAGNRNSIKRGIASAIGVDHWRSRRLPGRPALFLPASLLA